MRDVVRRTVLCGLLVALGGCGGAVGQPTGKIVWNGQPVAGAELMFESDRDAALQFFGRSGDDGVYQLSYRTFKGVPVGHYKVTVTGTFLPGGKPLPTGEAGVALRSSGKAARRAFLFERDVAAGSSTIDLDLGKAAKTVDLKPQ